MLPEAQLSYAQWVELLPRFIYRDGKILTDAGNNSSNRMVEACTNSAITDSARDIAQIPDDRGEMDLFNDVRVCAGGYN